ncbi:hypothetical protein CDA63_07145 [Hymenobacter amundsenii]|uniref:DUF4468 domain-containing protein n=1 Tax=Hymenobacter amundsenii TaxID=2006685 RepID=A0A246FM45_9BACT|nr:DUF4468 domain-containing protein [Hymenobacter amundsenii]OWP63759.1 hypothetical protein CDA63_07145 [Hymenobacter amundsenii]
MKKVLLSLLLGALPGLLCEARAQTEPPAPVGYTEQVALEGAGQSRLYSRALDWAQNKFTYQPKAALNAQPAAATIRLNGTGIVKTVDAKGHDQPLTVLFTFSFQATDNGYTYRVDSFQVIPDPRIPSQTVGIDEYRTELQADRNNDKTHNDRRVTAQANSLASEAAMSFRSYMNSQPQEESVGLAGEN